MNYLARTMLVARGLRLSVIQQQYDDGHLTAEEARELLSGLLTPGDETTRWDDSSQLVLRAREIETAKLEDGLIRFWVSENQKRIEWLMKFTWPERLTRHLRPAFRGMPWKFHQTGASYALPGLDDLTLWLSCLWGTRDTLNGWIDFVEHARDDG